MDEFLTPLDATLVDDTRNLWRLDSPLAFRSGRFDCRIEVPAGFLTDFDSVPRLPLAYWLTGDTGRAAAVLHDYLYELGVWMRDECDAIFLDAMLASGVPAWRAQIKYRGVRMFGGSAWDECRRGDQW